MAEFLVVDQTDLTLTFNFTTSLANYTGTLNYYLISSGSSTIASVTATVTTDTAILSTVSFDVKADAPLFTAEGLWALWPEILSSTSRFRSGQPELIEVRPRSQP